jgi:hypothetical protein
MKNKQTAVEWLWRWINDNQEATIEQGNKAFEQAKKMEKEQMFSYTKQRQIIGEYSMKFFTEDFEQYYNETYEK